MTDKCRFSSLFSCHLIAFLSCFVSESILCLLTHSNKYKNKNKSSLTFLSNTFTSLKCPNSIICQILLSVLCVDSSNSVCIENNLSLYIKKEKFPFHHIKSVRVLI